MQCRTSFIMPPKPKEAIERSKMMREVARCDRREECKVRRAAGGERGLRGDCVACTGCRGSPVFVRVPEWPAWAAK